MSKVIDHESKYSDEDREYLLARGQTALVQQNERRFGPAGDGADDFDPEQAGRNLDSVNAKQAVVENREAAAEQAKTVEGEPYRDPAPAMLPATGDELDAVDGAGGEEGIDDDIASFAEGLTVAELKARLDDAEVDYPAKAKHDDLAELYANVLQDKRDDGEDVNLSEE